MKVTNLVLAIMLLIVQLATGQVSDDWILKLNDSIYSSTDFEQLYTKNWDLIKNTDQKNIEKYADLYVLYKLKIQKAYQLKLDKKKNYKHEVELHRSELSEKYFIDETKLNQLVKEAVKRDKWQIKASHILLNLPLSAKEQDRVEVYERALAIREQITKEFSFEDAAIKYSEDPSVKVNLGNLGYFSVFQMVYPFESGAYETKVDDISLPIRTKFGYHLIYVKDKRLKKALREVSYVKISKKEHNSQFNINLAHVLLKNNQPFVDIVNHFASNDSDRDSQGYMGVFNQHEEFSKLFGKDLFALSEGEFTKPLQDDENYYIFKVDRVRPQPSENELKKKYTQRVKTDERSKILTDQLGAYLSKEYNLKTNSEELNRIVEKFDEYRQSPPKKEILFSYDNDKKIIYNLDFLKWAHKKQTRLSSQTDKSADVLERFKVYKTDKLKSYFNEKLTVKYPEFKNILEEFKSGILIFDLMKSEVWEKAKSDVIGQKEYYNNTLGIWKKEGVIQPYKKVKNEVLTKYLVFFEKEYERNLIKEAKRIEFNEKALQQIKKKHE